MNKSVEKKEFEEYSAQNNGGYVNGDPATHYSMAEKCDFVEAGKLKTTSLWWEALHYMCRQTINILCGLDHV